MRNYGFLIPLLFLFSCGSGTTGGTQGYFLENNSKYELSCISATLEFNGCSGIIVSQSENLPTFKPFDQWDGHGIKLSIRDSTLPDTLIFQYEKYRHGLRRSNSGDFKVPANDACTRIPELTCKMLFK